MLLDDVTCAHNNYLTILQCSYSTYIDSGCTSNSYDATVYCCKCDYLPFQYYCICTCIYVCIYTCANSVTIYYHI